MKQGPAYVTNKNTSGTKWTGCMPVPSPGVIHTRCYKFSCGLSIREAGTGFTAQPQSPRWEGAGGVSDTLWSPHATHLNPCFPNIPIHNTKLLVHGLPYFHNPAMTDSKSEVKSQERGGITSIGPFSPDNSKYVKIYEDLKEKLNWNYTSLGFCVPSRHPWPRTCSLIQKSHPDNCGKAPNAGQG